VTRDEVPPTIGLDTAARWLGISYESARRRAAAGRFPGAFQIGARWRVSRRALLREIERLAGLGGSAHEPVIPHRRPGAPRNATGRAHVPAAPLDRSRGESALTTPRLVVGDAPAPAIAASEPSLVHKRAHKS
jgi:hypothetical protein